MNSETLGFIFQITITALSAVGGLFCIYILGCIVFRNKSDLYIKGNTYLVLDIDEIGDKLEYYVRKIENDIDSRYIYISKILLYSKKLSKSKNIDSSTDEIYKICNILTSNYNNIIFMNDFIIENENDILSVIDK